MGKIYVNQTRLAIQADTKIDLTGWDSALIKYEKPDHTQGSFVATVPEPTSGIVEYDIASADDIDQAGPWTFWAYVTFLDGTEIAGEPHTRLIREQGK